MPSAGFPSLGKFFQAALGLAQVVRPVASVSIFVGLSLASVVVLNQADNGFWLGFIPQILACLLAGAMLRQEVWIALALAFVPTVLAGPFGDAEDAFNEGPPIAVFELVFLPAYLGLILIGWAVERAVRGARRRRIQDEAADL